MLWSVTLPVAGSQFWGHSLWWLHLKTSQCCDNWSDTWNASSNPPSFFPSDPKIHSTVITVKTQPLLLQVLQLLLTVITTSTAMIVSCSCKGPYRLCDTRVRKEISSDAPRRSSVSNNGHLRDPSCRVFFPANTDTQNESFQQTTMLLTTPLNLPSRILILLQKLLISRYYGTEVSKLQE